MHGTLRVPCILFWFFYATLSVMTPDVLLQKLLNDRGYITETQQNNFLNPKYNDMYDPFLMSDMEKAVLRIMIAIQCNERICIYSDYDADGIPGNALLTDFFRQIGYTNFMSYIPHRHNEGYGVHTDALRSLVDDRVDLVITIDLGITAVEQVQYGIELGLDIIITDHHEPLEIIPAAYAVVNPKLGNYPDRMLCGSGVVFKLVQAMIIHIQNNPTTGIVLPPAGFEKWLLDLAGLATLSDMVPLINENRLIAFFGMKILQKNIRRGLSALITESGIDVRHITETDVVFSLTPRINAASRMSNPMDALELLSTTDSLQARLLAKNLSNLNDTRKNIVKNAMKQVHEKMYDHNTEKNILVIGDVSWSPGILGIIAGKVVEKYNITTFVWGGSDSQIKGSVRGTGGVSVVTLMDMIGEHLVQYGGHADAGGFVMEYDRIHRLESLLQQSYDILPQVEIVTENVSYTIDDVLRLSDVTLDHYHTIRQLAPFGMGNREPVFMFEQVNIISVGQFGKTQEHIEMNLSQGSCSVRGIAWYSDSNSFTKQVTAGETVNVVARIEYSMFRGKGELRLYIVDIL